MDVALRLVVAIAAVGCSVPGLSLDGKACPCAPGYTCETSTNKCVAKLDGGRDTAIPPSCLGAGAPGASLTSGFAATFTTVGGTWMQSASNLVQSAPNSGLAIAYTTVTGTDAAMYRVVAHMTATSGGTAMGISLRNTSGTRTQYDCLWEPGSAGTLLWQYTNNGGQANPLATPLTALPTASDITMEVLATPTSLKCCLDNVSAATQTVTNPTPAYPSGFPGVAVLDMHATFDRFEVYAN